MLMEEDFELDNIEFFLSSNLFKEMSREIDATHPDTVPIYKESEVDLSTMGKRRNILLDIFLVWYGHYLNWCFSGFCRSVSQRLK